MPGDVATISLLDHLAEAGFRASIATTYNCYFPFFEEVVLRRLMAAGCTLELQAFAEQDELAGDACVRAAGEIEASDTVRDGARYLEAHTSDAHTLVLVHRTEEIAKNLGGDTRKALREALGALEEDPTQIEALLRLTEKVIFDAEDVVRSTPLRAAPGTEAPADDDASSSPTTLSLTAAGRRATSQRKKSVASGDIVVLLDALIRRLGEGLPTTASPPTRSEEESIGADDDDDDPPEPPDPETLSKACRAKVRRLIRRMNGQLELAAETERARRAIVQLAAVLGVVRTLRVAEQRPEWRRMRLELVDRGDEWELLQSAAIAVGWGSNALAARAIGEAGEGFDELSMVVGLLAWMAWDVRTDISVASRRAGLEGLEDEGWYAVQLLATLSPWLVDDSAAWKITEDSIASTPRAQVDGDRWLAVHREALETFALVTSVADEPDRISRHVKPGDLLVLHPRFEPRVRVVLDVRPGGSRGPSVVVLDPDEENAERSFLTSHVVSMPWEVETSAAAAG